MVVGVSWGYPEGILPELMDLHILQIWGQLLFSKLHFAMSVLPSIAQRLQDEDLEGVSLSHPVG